MSQDYLPRPASETSRERTFLEGRIVEVERDMGRLAATLGAPAPITQQLDVLDRARELWGDMLRQVRVRPLDDAVTAQLDWLDRVQERRARDDGAPKPDLNRVALDRRLLTDLLRSWRTESG